MNQEIEFTGNINEGISEDNKQKLKEKFSIEFTGNHIRITESMRATWNKKTYRNEIRSKVFRLTGLICLGVKVREEAEIYV